MDPPGMKTSGVTDGSKNDYKLGGGEGVGRELYVKKKKKKPVLWSTVKETNSQKQPSCYGLGSGGNASWQRKTWV